MADMKKFIYNNLIIINLYLGYITLPVVNVLKQILPSSSIVLKAGLPFFEKKIVTLVS